MQTHRFVKAFFMPAVLCFATLCAASAKQASAVSLQVGQQLPRFSLLKPGVHRYLRYKIADGHRSVLDVWTREIRYDAKDGRDLLHIVQEWDGAGADPYILNIDAWFEPGTFRPLTFEKHLTKSGKTTVAGYRFFADRIIGMPELPDNVRKGFTAPSPEPAYNFETDMEFLQALPLGPNYAASINFYDPGLDPPARYTFKVAGSDRIAGPDGRPIDCWVVTADYNNPKAVPTRFWFAKRTQVLIREESRLPDGSVLVKTLLNDEAQMPSNREGSV